MSERLIGLTEMIPMSMWKFGIQSMSFSYWLVRRTAWVVGTSAAILVLPWFIEYQRLQVVDMQDMHTRQVMAATLLHWACATGGGGAII